MEGDAPTDNLRREHDPGHLVVVQPRILHDTEHALGNLLQRIQHLARGAGGGSGDSRLDDVLSDLKLLLELLFDYVSPVDVRIGSTTAPRVLESLAAEVRSRTNTEVVVGDCPAVSLPVDRRLLGRAFQLLGLALGRYWVGASRIEIEVNHGVERECVEMAVGGDGPGRDGRSPDPTSDLALAVAGRWIELQGGELGCAATTERSACRIVLPLAGRNDVSD